jgi:hypothetical protein
MQEVTNMKDERREGSTFREGDQVVLDHGTYQGTLGVFLHLNKDVNWADIAQRNGSLWSHPVAWLAHAPAAVPAVAN